MNHFKILGIACGLMAMLKTLYMHIPPWDEKKFLKETYSGERPKWIISAAIFGVLLVPFTWFNALTTSIPYYLIITILFFLSAIKALFFIFDYEKFQQWIAGMLSQNKGKKVVAVSYLAGLFGLMVLLASFLIY